MRDRLQELDRLIRACEYHLNKAEDSHNVDLFNYWMAQRESYRLERAELLDIRIGCYGF